VPRGAFRLGTRPPLRASHLSYIDLTPMSNLALESSLRLYSSVSQESATPRPDPNRRERRKLELRARMLEAAIELFRNQGIEVTTVQEICDRADVARKTFFNHFSTKQRLLHAITEERVAEMLGHLDEAAKGAVPTRVRLATYFEQVGQHAIDAPPMASELLNETIHVANRRGSVEASRFRAGFERLVQACIDVGDVASCHDAETLGDMVMGAYYALVMNWAHLEDYPLPDRAKAAGNLLGDLLCEPREMNPTRIPIRSEHI
jgi:AcrR family transcriptional regulator